MPHNQDMHGFIPGPHFMQHPGL